MSPQLTAHEVLAVAASRSLGGVAGEPAANSRWVALAEVLDPGNLRAVLEARAARAGCNDLAAIGSIFAIDALMPLSRLMVTSWATADVLLDVSSVNVKMDTSGGEPHLALGEALTVTAGGDAALADAFVELLLDDTATVVVRAVQQIARTGSRQIWSSIALAAVNTLTDLSHETGRADMVRAALLDRRPDLARSVDLETIDDELGGTITYAIRRNCCLLVKVPDAEICGLCSFRSREERIGPCNQYYRTVRRAAIEGRSEV